MAVVSKHGGRIMRGGRLGIGSEKWTEVEGGENIAGLNVGIVTDKKT